MKRKHFFLNITYPVFCFSNHFEENISWIIFIFTTIQTLFIFHMLSHLLDLSFYYCHASFGPSGANNISIHDFFLFSLFLVSIQYDEWQLFSEYIFCVLYRGLGSNHVIAWKNVINKVITNKYIIFSFVMSIWTIVVYNSFV